MKFQRLPANVVGVSKVSRKYSKRLPQSFILEATLGSYVATY